MLQEGFGVAGNDLSIGAEILRRAALSQEFVKVSGRHFENDRGGFGTPHRAALDGEKSRAQQKAQPRVQHLTPCADPDLTPLARGPARRPKVC